ncbi:MAG: AMP-binding protein [Rhodospirillaceae bacterium]|jgi:cyclohexanecarboxylate-CoA ligase|nr:AMP-binding protein [Rhodospirillaceae bacterium]MBT5047232.1 AMP-binding protein [Rhodospirillaceae bacterium]MBT6427315.1 AMP-binding protein [Rhodospirillaceae bacterium]MBT7757019.1 AMP-binding protein [Rhodospirillaceae bacterium]
MAIREIYHDAATIEARVAAGEWRNQTLDDCLRRHAAERGEQLVLIDRKWRLTFAELDRLAHRAACGLYQLGIRPGDVISIQLPNWAEWLILHCAATKLGAVTNSIGAVYRQHEVGYILGYAETALLLIPDRYRNFDYTEMVAELWPDLPHLKHVFVAGEEVPKSMRRFDELLTKAWEDEVSSATIDQLRPDPNMVATLIFTSGTTAEPKGVMHTHNTMGAGTDQLNDTVGFALGDAIFMASPVGHTTAVIAGARLPVQYGLTAVWQEHWDAAAAVDLIHGERCIYTLSATPFLHGLMNAPNASRQKLKSLKTFACGGAPIPRELVKQADEDFDLFVSAIYGSSETLINSAVSPDAPMVRRYSTDGRIIPGVEGRLVDLETGEPAGPDDEGELQIQSAARYAGYYKDPETTRQVNLEGGWYATGDICTLDAEGYVSVVGRKKDMIIRGGANISAREIEELLFTHTKIVSAACVAMPDPVLSERVCAYVICAPGESLTFEEMISFLRGKQISAWKLPERLEIRDEFPMTPSGKIQKFLLRQEIAELIGEAQLVR